MAAEKGSGHGGSKSSDAREGGLEEVDSGDEWEIDSGIEGGVDRVGK